MAVGIFIGCSPFYGLQFWIGVAVAILLRLNKLALFLGTQAIIPPLVPVIIFCNVQIGAFIHQGRFLALSVGELSLEQAPSMLGALFLNWLTGWLLVGGAIALATYAITLKLLRRHRRTGQGQPEQPDQVG